MKKKLKGKITISRNSDDVIRITIEDSLSHIEFVEFELDLESYAKAVSGQGCIHGEFSVRGLDKVGKKIEQKPLVFEVPDRWGAKDWAQANAHKFAEEGWTASTYFASQSSIRYEGDKTIAHGTQFRYVEEE
jgi:hypothetical protein